MTQSATSNPILSTIVSSMVGSGLPTFISYLAPAHASMAPTMVAASSGQR
jgi:hypothetical protein